MPFKPRVCQSLGVLLQFMAEKIKKQSNPRLNNHSGTSSWFFLSQKKGWLQKQIQTNTHEHRWAPMSTHEHPWTPMNSNYFSFFSRPMQLANYMFNHCLYNLWFSILFVWSCLLIQGIFLWRECLFLVFILCWFGAQKKLSIAMVVKQVYTYMHTYIHTYLYYIYIYIVFWFASRVGLPHPIQDPSEIFACGCTTSFLASEMWNMSKCSQGVDVPNASTQQSWTWPKKTVSFVQPRPNFS